MDKQEVTQIVRETVQQVSSQIFDQLRTIVKPNGIIPHGTISEGTYLKDSKLVEVTLVQVRPNWPPYDEMVRKLFKVHPTNEVMAHHATTGIAGESGELRAATSRANAIEELGDLKFYMIALSQRLGPKPGQGGGSGEANNLRQMEEVQGSPYSKPTFANVLDHVHIVACELLDLTKKAWVYEDPKRMNELLIWSQLELLQINLDFYVVEVLGTNWSEIEFGNQMKLLGTPEQKGRYSSGAYSNEQALARADKS